MNFLFVGTMSKINITKNFLKFRFFTRTVPYRCEVNNGLSDKRSPNPPSKNKIFQIGGCLVRTKELWSITTISIEKDKIFGVMENLRMVSVNQKLFIGSKDKKIIGIAVFCEGRSSNCVIISS